MTAVFVVYVVLGSALLLCNIFLMLRDLKRPSKRHARREEIASMAVDYAEMMKDDKLRHALQAFGRIDLADNGKRDYSDAEARIAIEAVLARRK